MYHKQLIFELKVCEDSNQEMGKNQELFTGNRSQDTSGRNELYQGSKIGDNRFFVLSLRRRFALNSFKIRIFKF